MRRHLLPSGIALATSCLAVFLMTGPASALSTGNGGWRWQNPLPQGNSYASGWFVDARHGWLVSGGDIFHTSNGGVTLTVQARHNVSFTDITFADAKHGWAVGDPSNANTGTAIVYRTTNGGRLWTRVRLRLVADLNAVSFANTKVGWAVADWAVLHTVDGGLHWSVRQSSVRRVRTIGRFTDVYALGVRRAWLGGDSGTVLRTVNGGATWKRFHTGLGELRAIQFTSSSTGWAGGGGEIVHTSDGGAHWTSQLSTGNGAEMSGLSFADSRHGWVTTFGGHPAPSPAVYDTTDGGAHWTQQTAAPAAGWLWAFALAPSDAVIGGVGGRLNHTSDGGTTWQPGTQAAAGFFGNLYALQFIDSSRGWTAGSAGEILKTSDGGVAWEPQDSGTSQDLHDMKFVDAENGWAVGDQGTIVHTTDGGATWTPQTSGFTDDLAGVTFADAQHGWAVGGTIDLYDALSTGVIVNTTDGGQHWTKQTTPVADAALSDVAFAGPQHGWAVGEIWGDAGTNATVILATIDGGATWTRQLTYYPPMTGNTSNGVLTSVACIDAERAVAVGSDDSGTEIFRTVNGGARWTRLVQPVSWGVLDLTDVVFADATHGWAVGPGLRTRERAHTVIKTTDGGRTWTKQFVGPTDGLYALSFVSPTQGWVAGQDANILTTATGGNAP
jgi:photosystem II stability/assembly factor-like uncharacterized protein